MTLYNTLFVLGLHMKSFSFSSFSLTMLIVGHQSPGSGLYLRGYGIVHDGGLLETGASSSQPNCSVYCSAHPKKRLRLPPICSRSNKKLSCPKRLRSSPNSTCVTLLLPPLFRVSAISLCCHAGNRISLATPIISAGWFRSTLKPAIKSCGGPDD